MNPRVLPLVFLCAVVGASGLSLERRHVAPNVDYGSAVGDALNNFIQTNLSDPLKLLPEGTEKIDIDLAELSQKIIGEGQTPPIKGSLSLADIFVKGVKQTGVDKSVFDLPSIVRPVNIDIVLSNAALDLEGQYEIDATLMSLIPVRGKGRITLRITNLKAGAATLLKMFPLPMKVDAFNYLLTLDVFQVHFEDLIGGGDLSDKINEILNNLIQTQLLPGLTDPESSLHASINAILADVVNGAVSELTAQDLLDLLNGLLKP
ncbi:unnamed protein product [Allacma fusca]|uniref:Hemolymph juvenile hormone binding protein n=1 Tax=Allacma fusca TaxID=39272 RepID=A0A8J2MBM5_9HEXA|nr:unnamed protein product [Allacma fusca]